MGFGKVSSTRVCVTQRRGLNTTKCFYATKILSNAGNVVMVAIFTHMRARPIVKRK